MNASVEREYQPLKKWKLCVLAISGLPFAFKAAYLAKAWGTSPIDAARIGLWGSGVLLVVVVTSILKLIYRFPTNKPLRQSRALRLLPLPIALYVFGVCVDLNAVQLIASVGIAWTTAWMLYGRVVGSMLAVAAVMAVLAVPGSSYWLSKTTTMLSAPTHAAFVPKFAPRSQNGFLGREVRANDAFRNFFRTSEAHQFRYASVSNEISVLAVRVGQDIHEIHPATHCLRSSGWLVESETLRDVTLPGRADPLSLTESIVANSAGKRLVIWVWYSSPAVSTGSFIRFRRMYAADTTWHTYQITAAVGRDGDIESARRNLSQFLEAGEEMQCSNR